MGLRINEGGEQAGGSGVKERGRGGRGKGQSISEGRGASWWVCGRGAEREG